MGESINRQLITREQQEQVFKRADELIEGVNHRQRLLGPDDPAGHAYRSIVATLAGFKLGILAASGALDPEAFLGMKANDVEIVSLVAKYPEVLKR
ncbi:hypothetical protein HYS96_01040 [Candidatus Daviesbacteria bacterium]|nr:hypothetical protein [Candidatus Daviesbacteria bacterium]